MAALLPGCVNTQFKTNAPIQSFVVADEPRAAAIGRDIIKQGGLAGDAAAAMALAMTATLPSRVGLGGGGVCLTFDTARKQARTIDFLPRPAGPGGVAMPAMLRGLYAVHAGFSALRWEQVAVPAEQLAQFSPAVSRALAQDLTDFGGRLAPESELRRRLMPGGTVPAIGSPYSQPELAATLSLIRRNGVAAMYSGPLAAQVAQATGIDPAALRAYQPRTGETVSIPLGIVSMHFPKLPDSDVGEALARAWKAAEDLKPAERMGRVMQVLGAATGGAVAPGAGLMVIDPKENGIACALTLGAPFGSGRAVPGTGIVAAQAVERAGFGVPGLVGNAIVGRTLFAGVGSAKGDDGPNAAALALMNAALPAALDEQPGGAILASRPASLPGRASFIACQVSTENGLKDCQPSPDPRANGIGAIIETERERE